jgi:FKBP-type peptidyl-prolyl cis-trans isomerase SlyD
MEISENKVATIHYTLTNDENEVLDTSINSKPLSYIQGHQNIIPGLEKALAGKSAGNKLTVKVSPEEGYGVKNETLIQSVPKEMFGDLGDIQIGMQFQVNTGDGGILLVTATEITDSHVVVDGNHPLAGMNLTFEVEILEVRDASEEELSHGHLHAGAGCCGGGADGGHCHEGGCSDEECEDDGSCDEGGGCCMH